MQNVSIYKPYNIAYTHYNKAVLPIQQQYNYHVCAVYLQGFF